MLLIIACLVFAGSQDFEPMYFNENNQLSFETIDNVATSTAYKTLGWIIKKYDLPIDDPNNISITCSLRDESYVGDDGKAHTLFYVNREDVLNKVSEVSAEWAAELRNVGGVVFLDSIMTVRQNGYLQGELYEDGSYSGEVYFTYAGISNARYWRNPTDLMQDYDRTVIISADPDIYIPRQDIIKFESKKSIFNYENQIPSIWKKSSIYSNEYDVQVAIPSTENVNVIGKFSKYAYMLNYKKVTGKRTYGVKVQVRTRLYWIDANGNERTEEVYYSKWYYIDRQYCYYIVNNFELYQLSGWNFQNTAIGNYYVDYNADLDIVEISNAHLANAEYPSVINIDAGTIYGQGNYRPTVSIQNYSNIVDSYVGNINTESDYISIDGEEILGNAGAKLPIKNETVNLTKNNVEIGFRAENGANVSASECIYSKYNDENDKYKFAVGINNMMIHTPVVCTSSVNNNETENKLEIGKDFTVGVQNIGQHNNIKGFGWRDYSKFVDCNQVKFPFDVIKDGQFIKKESWIVVNGLSSKNVFSLVDNVLFGEYVIEFRALALNYNDSRIDLKEENYNKYFQNYNAYSYQKVSVSGPTGERDVKNYEIVGTH